MEQTPLGDLTQQNIAGGGGSAEPEDTTKVETPAVEVKPDEPENPTDVEVAPAEPEKLASNQRRWGGQVYEQTADNGWRRVS